MIYIEFKNKYLISYKKLRHARAIAKAIKGIRWANKQMKREYIEVELDYKIILK